MSNGCRDIGYRYMGERERRQRCGNELEEREGIEEEEWKERNREGLSEEVCCER